MTLSKYCVNTDLPRRPILSMASTVILLVARCAQTGRRLVRNVDCVHLFSASSASSEIKGPIANCLSRACWRMFRVRLNDVRQT